MNFKKEDFHAFSRYWLVPACMFLLACVCLPFLPGLIAMHWNAAWTADSWGSKWGVLLFSPASCLFLLLLGPYTEWFCARFSCACVSTGGDRKLFAYRIWLVLSLLTLLMELFMIASGFHTSVNGARFLLFSVPGAVLSFVSVCMMPQSRKSWGLEIFGLLLMTAALI